MIDLHSHTNESDGTVAPADLIDLALRTGLDALAITDHDTFAGYDQAAPIARAKGLDLVCGIEINTRLAQTRNGRDRSWSVHLLGYFLNQPPPPSFREWLLASLESRRQRNLKLVARLKEMGVDIELAEVQAMGRTLTGRPHFARVLMKKGYVASTDEAFRKYLGEESPGFVHRDSPATVVGIERIVQAGGLAVLAHPIRLGIKDPVHEEAMIAEFRDVGLGGLEVYHSDHSPRTSERYAKLATQLDLAVTGGSDFHGDAKPAIQLGTGADNNLNVGVDVLVELRERFARRS